MDVGAWLRSLGLAQYEALFRQNDIDAEVLGDLTDADLEKLGLTLGHRKRLLKAIASLDGAEPVAKPTSPAPPSLSTDAAERRPITIMFCDLVGSTNLAARLDAEDWRNLVGAYLDEAAAAVTGLGGHVLKKLGDGLMALFGYPHAQENDAERAVRAALAIQRALAELNARNARSGAPELSARIGIESGSVVVDAAGEVFGEAPNLAARVQAAAEPGTVLVTANVQRQTAGLFVAEDKGAHELKGVLEPVTLYRIVRASGAGRRSGARALTPLVGREDELALLTRRWSRALEGEGQFVQIVGEPGIGKSRLVEEFRAKLAETPHTWVEWAASQLLQNTPLHPLAEWGRLRYGGADASDGQKLADLENTLRLIGLDAAEYAPLLAPLFDVPLPEDRAAKFAPEELRRRQLAAMTALFLAGARSQPVVLAFEDLHWADPTSLDLLRALVERGAQAPLLILATTRPEFRPDWSLRSHHSVISLAPLDRAQVRRMVGEIASRHALSDETIDGVGERTGGVPLFVEEVTRLLIERDAQGGALAIPPTLQQSLAARLDRLGEAREVAQIGAVLGREFSFRLLREVSSSAAEIDEQRLHAALDRLVEADLIFVDGAPPTAAYRFKHALIQDAAYDSLLRSRRQALHRRAAEALRDADAEPEAIAHHFTEAALDDLAIEWWGKAGDQALRRSAFQEAIAHLGKAIAMADKAGAPERRAIGGAAAPSQRLTQLHVARANALFAARGVGATETTEAFARARESAYGDKDTPERLAADWGLWAGSYTRGDLPSMRTHAAVFLSDLEARPDSPEAGVAHRAAGITCWFAGEYREARDHCERALALFQSGRDDELAFRFGHDPGVAAIAFLAITLWPLGEVDRAISLIDGMQARIADLSHVGTLAGGRMHAAFFELMRGDNARAAPNAFELARLAREHDLVMWRALGVFLQGCATAASGSIGGGLEDMRRGTELLSEQKVLLFDGLLKIALAEAETRAGDPDRAIAILDEALATADRLGYRAFEAELHRARGETLHKRDPANPAPAEGAFLTAIAVAKQQGTCSFQLRAALSLARLYQSTGRPVEAHAILTPALEAFQPTPEMREIAEATALLAALAEAEEVKVATAQRERRLRLQTAYGQAMMWSKGFAAEETKAAFARATELAAKSDDFSERFAAAHGQWTLEIVRCELKSAQELASAFLRQAEEKGRVTEAGVARRGVALISYYLGDFVEARTHCEQALAACDAQHEEEARERYGEYTGTVATACLAVTTWHLGEIERARELIEIANRRATELGHPPSMAGQLFKRCELEILRGDAAATLSAAEALEALSREHGLALFRLWAELSTAWARGRLHDPAAGAAEVREALTTLTDQGQMLAAPIFYALLAELEAETLGAERAMARIDEALALAHQLGQRAELAFFHRLRGEILLKRDPAGAEPAEEAFRTAIAIAKQQGARSYELRAALSLAKLYQSTAQPAEAHVILAPALEGFSPTPEMPEIAEAQALLAELAQTGDVKAEAARRKRLTQLHAAYGNALIAARGYGAPETTEAFARARKSASGDKDAPERLATDYGLWVGSLSRGELPSMRAHTAAFLGDLEARPNSPETSVAHRAAGMTCWFAGEYGQARDHLQCALASFQPGRDDDLAFRFGTDSGVAAMAYLAISSWALGEVDRSVSLIERMQTRIAGVTHIGTRAYGKMHAALFELMRGDRARAAANAFELARLAREYDLNLWRAWGVFLQGWANVASGAPAAGLKDMRLGAELLREQNVLIFDGLLKIALAEAEARAGDPDRAVAILDEALATCDRVGHRAFEAELHRVRGEVLFKRDPANPAPAEDAFLTAIAVAKQQATRSFELRAALSLAKLYQSTGRPADARAVLAPALEGFSPTPEMPEIAEAQALLAG